MCPFLSTCIWLAGRVIDGSCQSASRSTSSPSVGCHFCHAESPSPSPGRSDRGAMLELDLIHSPNNSSAQICATAQDAGSSRHRHHILLLKRRYSLTYITSARSGKPQHSEGQSHPEVGTVRTKEDEKPTREASSEHQGGADRYTSTAIQLQVNLPGSS